MNLSDFAKPSLKVAIITMLPLFAMVLLTGYSFIQNIGLTGTPEAWRFHYSLIGFLLLFAMFFSAFMVWILIFYFRKKKWI